MFKRPFWLGLLLGSLAAAGSLLRRSAAPGKFSPLLDLAGDALVVCDAAGTIISSNAAARQLFGPHCAGLSALRYPNGQPVPPGQLPHVRALRSGAGVISAEYHFVAAGGPACVLDVSASALPGGGAAAVLRNVTALHMAQAHLDQTQARQTALHHLGRRLNQAAALDAIGRAVVEEAYSLLGSLPDVQVRLYGYNTAVQILTRLASEPEDRPKRPKSAAEARLPEFPFDAGVPALWQLYIARQPSTAGPAILGEASAASAYALPLLAGGLAIGHLSLSSSAADAFDDPNLVQALGSAVSAAALALSVPQAGVQAESFTAQLEAVREIAHAVAGGAELGRLMDLAVRHIRRITQAEVCTVSLAAEGKLSVAGKAFRDDLLYPERWEPGDPALQSKATGKAWRTQKPVTHLGLVPSVEAGPWRAFAGKSGKYFVTALPLASRLGVLAVYTNGAMPLLDVQIKFLETVAALLSVGLVSSGLKPASAEASRADC